MNKYWDSSANRLEKIKRILIIGDPGLGKTTLAHKIAEKTNLPCYSTDDFYWKVKYTEIREEQERIAKIRLVYSNEQWIVEGLSTHLIAPGLEQTDLIINLRFKYFLPQVLALIKRSMGRGNESFLHLIRLIYKAAWRRYSIGNRKNQIKAALLEPYKEKTLLLRSFKETDEFVRSIS